MGRAPGPSSERHQVAAGRRRSRRARPESLSRTRSAAEASSSASAITRRRELAPMPVAPAAPVGERRQTRAADRDVRLTDPPGAAEAVGDHHHGWGDPGLRRSRCRIRRADASPSSGSSETRPSSRLEESMPAFAQTQPASVSVIRTPRLGAHDALGSPREPARPGPGPCRAPLARSRARSPGSTSVERPHAPLDLGDGLLRDDHDLVAAAGAAASAIRRPRSSPSCSSGSPVSGRIRS